MANKVGERTFYWYCDENIIEINITAVANIKNFITIVIVCLEYLTVSIIWIYFNFSLEPYFGLL